MAPTFAVLGLFNIPAALPKRPIVKNEDELITCYHLHSRGLVEFIQDKKQ